MYSKIKRLRIGGARRSDREIQSDPGVVGHVTVASVGATREMSVYGAGDDGRRVPLIPLLFEPQIVAMGSARMLVIGFERKGDANGPTFMQEWAIEINVPQPDELANVSHRPPGG